MPEPYFVDDAVTLWHGDCLDVLTADELGYDYRLGYAPPAIPDESIDAVVTDPPYGLEFMGKEWDSFRVDERTARWSGENAGSAGELKESHLGGGSVLPSYTRARTTAQCQTCGKRDAFRNPHACDADGTADWLTIRVDGIPMEMRAFQNWCEQWARECRRVLKPGGHLLAFGGTRTWHRLAVAVEEVGFDVRDSIAWMYASGFPKSHDVSKAIDKAAGAEREPVRVDASQVRNPKATGAGRDGTEGATRPWIEDALERGFHEKPGDEPVTDDARTWQGWGTALKPAFEPVVVARKHLAGTVAGNVLRHGTGALNIDACRTELSEEDREKFLRGQAGWADHAERHGEVRDDGSRLKAMAVYGDYGAHAGGPHDLGRWPANVVLDEDQADVLDAQSGERPAGGKVTGNQEARTGASGIYGEYGAVENRPYGDTGGASRFYFVAKAGTAERPKVDGVAHPTVKPLALMRWLVRLVTPPGGVVLEPFTGSGTTVEACLREGVRVVAIEREAEYLPLIEHRIARGHDPLLAVREARVRRRPPTAGADEVDLFAYFGGDE